MQAQLAPQQPTAAPPAPAAPPAAEGLDGVQTCIRKGSRGQAITALVHVPAAEEQPGHLGFLWFYLSRGLFSGSLYRRDLSKQEDWELRDARHNPDVSCMCYDDVNHVVWTGHRNGGIRVWYAATGKAVVDVYSAFHSPVAAITTDERGCCWAGTSKGKVRCFRLEAIEADGVHQGYRVAKLGELNTVSERVPIDYCNAERVNGMLVHPDAREPAHYGPVRSIAAAMGRVWTSGGSSAFASFKEWTQQGVLLGSQSMRLTGLVNDIVLISQVVKVQETQKVSVDAPWGNFGSFSEGGGGVASMAADSQVTVSQLVDVDMPWQLLTIDDSGAIQVWGVVDKSLVPLARIGDRVAPALRLVVCEPLGLLITAHNDGKLRLRALPHPMSPERITVTYHDSSSCSNCWPDQLLTLDDATLPCAQIETSKTGLAQAVGGGMLGVTTASNYATIKHYPTAELRRVVEEHNAEHSDRQMNIWPAANVNAGQFPMLQLSPAGLAEYLEDVNRQVELLSCG
ncbi:serine threonine- kinase drkA isoform A [Chlorella sorokiniana]|uniref:Serine threonine-kinase drkA isoform A n=1 Tax=Chlorella sorokiniana TaxID=3076 RepID=A0A2P6TM93_CHLSO|nr:serine threonine- kinase drkA isoform A [Chlorella sorokiniana]|eukprot:PRW45448.1 serine threonine- kinase drkA isoform A [Chlorella sorokiniana]